VTECAKDREQETETARKKEGEERKGGREGRGRETTTVSTVAAPAASAELRVLTYGVKYASLFLCLSFILSRYTTHTQVKLSFYLAIQYMHK